MLSENRISINEILTEMRIQKIGDISDVEYAILEQNGKISLFQKTDNLVHTLITDGAFDTYEMGELNLTEKDVVEMLGGWDVSDIFLLTVDDDGQRKIIWREGAK